MKREIIMEYSTDDNNWWDLMHKEELIRCKNCRYADIGNDKVFCIKNKKYFPVNGFCSKGEKDILKMMANKGVIYE